MALRHWFITLLLLFSLPLSAQVEEALEQWIEETDDTEAAAEMSDLLLQLQDVTALNCFFQIIIRTVSSVTRTVSANFLM